MYVLGKNKGLIRLLFIDVFLVINLILFFAIADVCAFKEANIVTNKLKKNNISQSIMEYRNSIRSINDQIASLKENRTWLGLKIARIKDFNRPVPESMKKSFSFKTMRINALIKFKKTLNDQLKNLIKTADRFDMEGKNNSESREINFNSSNKQAYDSIQNRNPLAEKACKKKFIETLRYKIKKAGLGAWVEVTSDNGCCRLVTTLPILFASGSAAIARTYKAFFKKLANLIRGYDVRIIVNGYADIDSIHNKKYPSNFELGAARAANVVHTLVKYGIKPSVFKISTTGKYRFNASGMSKKKVVERRADLTIIFSA